MAYIYLGHGNELLTQRGGRYIPRMRTIPDGCTLSTISESGTSSALESVLNLCTISSSPTEYSTPDILMNPVQNFKMLSRLFTGRHYDSKFLYKNILLGGVFHVNQPREEFIDKQCDFLFSFQETRDTVILNRSGLYDITKLTKPLPILSNGDVIDSSSYNINKLVGITKQVIREVYQDSLFPRAEEILQTIYAFSISKNINGTLARTNQILDYDEMPELIPYHEFKTAVLHMMRKYTVGDIMEQLRGHHYFFVCRNYENPRALSTNNLLSIQARSRNKAALLGEISPVVVDKTMRGKNLFELFIQEYYTQSGFFKGYEKPTKEILSDLYSKLEIISKKRGPAGMKFVIDFIEKINEAIQKRLFTVNDIDTRLLRTIRNFFGDIDLGVLKIES